MDLKKFNEILTSQGAKEAFEEEILNKWGSPTQAEAFVRHAVGKSDSFGRALDSCFDFEASILGEMYWERIKNRELCR